MEQQVQDTTIPFYLREAYNPPKPTEAGIDFSYDYSYLDSRSKTSTGLWEELAQATDSGINTVFDKASGTWKAVKDATTEIIQAPISALGSIMDTLKENILWVLVVGLVVIVVVAKTGIIKQAAGLLK